MTLGHQISAACSAALMALLIFPVASRFGQRGVDQWLSEEERQRLGSIGRPWWVTTAIVGGLVSWQALFPLSAQVGAMSLAWLTQNAFIGSYAGILIALARIDLASRLLPDQLTASLVLSGLMFHWLFDTGQLMAGIQGAALGYGLLWILARLFEWLRGREAMGRGDFFMAAGLGAWLGWQGLPMVLMLASLSALLAALVARLARPNPEDPGLADAGPGFLKQEIAFGPALAFGGIAAWILIHG